MDNRKYNIYFHTHTISGIIICGLLYVIFFAGSFAFFKDDIAAWQQNRSNHQNEVVKKDFAIVIDSLSKKHKLKGRDFDFNMQRSGVGAYVSMSASHDTTLKKKPKEGRHPKQAKRKGRGRRGNDDSEFFTYDFASKKASDYTTSYTMGEFFYRLHFLAPLNEVPIRLGTPFGYLIAGIVSFIFVFALLTGLLLHWDKIKSNFFVFRPWNKWKTVWTDLHTALGVIGFPFQFVFAVTGVVLIANFLLVSPYTQFLYKGKAEVLYHELEYSDTTQYKYSYKPLDKDFDVNGFVSQIEGKWHNSELTSVAIRNYQDSNMHVIVQAKPQTTQQYAGLGKLIYRVHDGKIIYEKSPLASATYVDKVKSLIYHLHFGDFGGRPLRVMFFVLGIMGCIVINSGVLIWLVARDKNNVAARKRKFNFWTANVFISSSMAMLPVAAITMIAVIVSKTAGQPFIYHWFFYTWLVLSVYFLIRRDLSIVNRQSFLLSAVTCLALPVVDGLIRGNWIWVTFAKQAYDLLFIDVFFICLSVISAVIYLKVKNRKPQTPNTNNVTRTGDKRPKVQLSEV
ncbi:MAG: PepSY domain-containing protein [Mucilaginibacter sp.]|nr:PepSY domain-containing protein [Mucilaginibacter sp.]